MRKAVRHIPTAALALCLLALTVPAAGQDNSYRAPVQTHIPMQIIESEPAQAKPAQPEAQPQGKFKNRDTAKNRQDYEVGTDSGAETIQLGRDEDTGDTVMSHTPPKKKPQENPLEGQPIQVKPIVPVRRY